MRGEHDGLPWPEVHEYRRPPRAWRALKLEGELFEGLVEDLHVRGEHRAAGELTRQLGGRPPRAWRAHQGSPDRCVWMRKTSTCVESTCAVSAIDNAKPEDLHVRGEHATNSAVTCKRCRKTSTCVESTPHHGGCRSWCAEDLHVRGEHNQKHGKIWSVVGRPPRAWRARSVGRFATCRGPEDLHVRGEHREWYDLDAARRGRPPRAWRAHLATCGFIQAFVRFQLGTG